MWKGIKRIITDVTINILLAGNKLTVQRGFIKSSVGYLFLL